MRYISSAERSIGNVPLKVEEVKSRFIKKEISMDIVGKYVIIKFLKQFA